MTKSRLITRSDSVSIDRAQHQLESTLGMKFNTVNVYDFWFTEETVEPNNCCNMHISKPSYNDCNKDISNIQLYSVEEKQIFIKEEFMCEIDSVKTEEVFENVKQETHNNFTTAFNCSDIKEEEGYTDTGSVSFSNKDSAIDIKQESTSDKGISVDDESVSYMSKEERYAVSVKQSNMRANNSKNKSKMPLGYNEMVVLENENSIIYNTDHASKRFTVLADKSKKCITKRMENEIAFKNKIIRIEDDFVKVKAFSSESEKTVKLPESVTCAATCTIRNINSNTSRTTKLNNSILSDTEDPRELFICDICGKSFHHKRSLLLHIRKHAKMHYCTYCSYKTYIKGHLKRHVNSIHTKSEVLNCAHCSYKAYEKGALLTHVNSKHTKSEVFNCAYCSYKAYQKGALLIHINAKHTKSEVFYCAHCSYRAYRKDTLLRHVNAKHTKNEVLNCAYCNYKAYEKGTFLIHVNSKHTKSKVFNCSHCSYKTYRKGTLLRHINAIHTKRETFNCDLCNYKAYQKSAFLTHINAKHNKSEVFSCSQCSFKSYSKGGLNKHLKRNHSL